MYQLPPVTVLPGGRKIRNYPVIEPKAAPKKKKVTAEEAADWVADHGAPAEPRAEDESVG